MLRVNAQQVASADAFGGLRNYILALILASSIRMLFVNVQLKNIFAFSVQIVKEVTFLKKKDKLILLFFSKNGKRADIFILSKTLFFGFSVEAVPRFKLQESISYSKVISLPWAPGRLNHRRSCHCLDVVDIFSEFKHHLIARNARKMCGKLEKKKRLFYLHLLSTPFFFMTSQTKCLLHQQRSHEVIISKSIRRFDKDN